MKIKLLAEAPRGLNKLQGYARQLEERLSSSKQKQMLRSVFFHYSSKCKDWALDIFTGSTAEVYTIFPQSIEMSRASRNRGSLDGVMNKTFNLICPERVLNSEYLAEEAQNYVLSHSV